MRRFTISEKRAGEMAVRRMSDKAQDFYNGTDPLAVYEYEDEDEDEDEEPVKLYAIRGCIGDRDGMTFDELGKLFEEEQERSERLDAEEAADEE